MYKDKKVVVVLPAYNAASTIEKTILEIPSDIVDEIVLVDDKSSDNTIDVAKKIGIQHIIQHTQNKGYGGNQKSCYRKALELNADIIIMLHPDYQYTPALIPAMASMVASGSYPCVLASRILGGGALRGGMPLWKYLSNRFLTLIENLLLDAKLSEYHTGYRAFARSLLERLPLEKNSDDFVFDNQMLAQIIWLRCAIGEVTCPAQYLPDSSSINFGRSVTYGFGCLATAMRFRLARWGLSASPL